MIGSFLSSRWSAWEDKGADVWVVWVLRGGVCRSVSYSSSFVAGTGHPSFVLSPVHQGESAGVGDLGSVAQGCYRPSVCLATGVVKLYPVMGLPASSGWTAVPQGSSVLACWLAPMP